MSWNSNGYFNLCCERRLWNDWSRYKIQIEFFGVDKNKIHGFSDSDFTFCSIIYFVI